MAYWLNTHYGESMKKINLPTKITIFRIVLSFIIILGLIALYFVDKFMGDEPYFVASLGFSFELIQGCVVKINYVYVAVFIIFLAASISDCIDGHIARSRNLITDLGKFLDPVADKMLINSLLIFLAIGFPSMNKEGGYLSFHWFLVVLMIVRDLVVDGLRLIGATKNVVISANVYGKLKTIFQMIAIGLVLVNGFPFAIFDANWPEFLHITEIICYIATFISILSGVIYVKDNKKVL